MTVQERLQLLNYGYTKEQVDAMEQPTAQPVQTQAPIVAQPAAQPVQTQAPAATQPTATQQLAQAGASDFLTTLTALGAMLNAQNAQPATQASTLAQPTAQAPAAAQPAPTQQPAQPVAPAPVQLSPQQLTQLIQGVAVQTASGTIETPPTAEQALLNMFNSVAGEVNRNEQN